MTSSLRYRFTRLFSAQNYFFECLLVLLILQIQSSEAFTTTSSSKRTSTSSWTAPPTKSTTTQDTDDTPQQEQQQQQLLPLLDWNASSASGSIGSLLLQMQKKEQELKQINPNNSQSSTSSSTLLDPDQALDLDNYNKANQTLSEDAVAASALPSQPPLDPMNYETAKELDQSVTTVPQLGKPLTDGMILLDMPKLYNVLLLENQEEPTPPSSSSTTQSPTTTLELELPSLSRPDHYQDRIGRDMRHLAVSIASSVNTIEQWRLFYALYGGIFPLVECIQEGAMSIRNNIRNKSSLSISRQQPGLTSEYVSTQYEESFLAASSALCALRDLCALSPELSAVLTDGLLRANTGTIATTTTATATTTSSKETTTSLLDDICTLLTYAHDRTEYDYQPARRRLNIFRPQKAAKWTISRRRNRKGKFIVHLSCLVGWLRNIVISPLCLLLSL